MIPARLQATRLPNKPLRNIADKPLIAHAWQQAKKADLGEVYVACGEEEIQNIIESEGGRAIRTPIDLPSGTDRIFHALQQVSNAKPDDIIINLQGDIAVMPEDTLHSLVSIFQHQPDADIATLANFFAHKEEADNPHHVKIVGHEVNSSPSIWQAYYFSRTKMPYEADARHILPLFHHIGIYAYRYQALEKFVQEPPADLEKLEKLEQLRALKLNQKIYFTPIKGKVWSVDTQEDLDKVEQFIIKGDI